MMPETVRRRLEERSNLRMTIKGLAIDCRGIEVSVFRKQGQSCIPVLAVTGIAVTRAHFG